MSAKDKKDRGFNIVVINGVDNKIVTGSITTVLGYEPRISASVLQQRTKDVHRHNYYY